MLNQTGIFPYAVKATYFKKKLNKKRKFLIFKTLSKSLPASLNPKKDKSLGAWYMCSLLQPSNTNRRTGGKQY